MTSGDRTNSGTLSRDSGSIIPNRESISSRCCRSRKTLGVGAFARFSAVIEGVGRSAVPVRVRELLQEHVDSWSGEDPGMSRQWVEDAVADLSDDEKASGRLALLAALASYQVDEDLIKNFRQHFPSDKQLISTAAWASFVAAKRVAGWLQLPPKEASAVEDLSVQCSR
jgi:hypothetical protein